MVGVATLTRGCSMHMKHTNHIDDWLADLESGPGLQVDIDAHQVLLNGRSIELTTTEFTIIAVLHARANRVVTYEQLAEHVWGFNHYMSKRAIEVQVCRLRSKLGESGAHPRLIRTIRGVGYRFTNDDDAGLLASLTWDADLTVVAARITDETYFGVQPTDVIGTHWVVPGTPWAELDHESQVALVRQLFAMELRHWDGEMHLAKPDGTPFVSDRCTQLLSLEGELFGAKVDFRAPQLT